MPYFVFANMLLGSLLLFFSPSSKETDRHIYIDPSHVSDIPGDGSLNNPYTSWDAIEIRSNTTYRFKKSTRLVLTRPLNILNKQDIMLTSYGEGNPPIIHTGNLKKPFHIHHSRQITIKNLSIQGETGTIYALRILGACQDILIKNCHITNAMWGIRIIGFREKQHPRRIQLSNTRIENIGEDGIFARYASELMVDSCHIAKVNQQWFRSEKPDSNASGDGIQLYNCANFTIQNSYIDRSDTGNKFCLIASGSTQGKILHNTMIGPSGKGNGGAAIYLGQRSDSIRILKNKLYDAPCGIYTHAKNLLIYKNILENNQTGAVVLDARRAMVINNTFVNNQTALKGSHIEILNNIFYARQTDQKMLYLTPPYRSDYNCFFIAEREEQMMQNSSLTWFGLTRERGKHSFFSDPMLDTSQKKDRTLKNHSPCIDRGMHPPVIAGFSYMDIPCGKGTDIGAAEFCLSDKYTPQSTTNQKK
jgi:hypothetical protein